MVYIIDMNNCSKPSVDIWWFNYDVVLFADSIVVEKGLLYGDCITGLSDHADSWDKLEKNGELDKLPTFLPYLSVIIFVITAVSSTSFLQ